MKQLLLTPALALAAAPALWGQDRVPADMRALIPADVRVFVRADSLAELETTARDLAQVIAPDFADEIDLDLVFEEAPPGFDKAWIDLTRPIGFTVSAIDFAGSGEPTFCMFIPTTDAGALGQFLAQDGEFNTQLISGGYLGVSSAMGSYPAPDPTSDVVDRIPAGVLSGMVDLAPIVDEMGPMFRGFSGMGRGMVLGEINNDTSLPAPMRAMAMDLVDGAFDFLDGFVASLTELRISLDVDGTVVSFDYSLHFAPDSPVAELKSMDGPRFGELRRFMDVNAPQTSALGFDLGNLAGRLRPYVDEILNAVPVPEVGEAGPFASPQAAFAAARDVVDRSVDLFTHFGDGMVSSNSIGAQGMSSAGWIHGVTGDQFAGSLRALFEVELASMVGLQLSTIETTESTQRMALGFEPMVLAQNFGLSERDLEDLQEFKQIFFPHPMELSTTTVGNRTLLVVNGSRDSITGALQSAKQSVQQPSPLLDQAGALLGDSYPFSVTHYQFGQYIGGMLSFVSTLESNDAPPQELIDELALLDMPAVIYAGFNGTSFKNGVRVDVRDVGKMIEMIDAAEAKRFEEYPPPGHDEEAPR